MNMDDFFTRKTCSRCGRKLDTRIMSRFNEDVLCIDCAEKEKEHPRYKEAVDTENAEIKAGNYNYKGLCAGKKYPFESEGLEE